MSAILDALRALPRRDRSHILARLSDQQLVALRYSWRFWARAEQLPPPGDWSEWLVVTGRGFGKTRLAVEWVRERVESGVARRIALVGVTEEDAFDVFVEGESGFLACSPPWFRPVWHEKTKTLTWPNGARARVFTAEKPRKLRGPAHDTAIVDELAAYDVKKADELMMNLRAGMRLGRDPRLVVTTTPKPRKILREMAADGDVAKTRGSTYANAANVPAKFVARFSRYEGTTRGREEIHGEILDDRAGALFDLRWVRRVDVAPPLERVVVAVDPAVSTGPSSDETGIIVIGIAAGRLYLLADRSGRYTPEVWAGIVVGLFDVFEADAVVGETNRGGDLVAANIKARAREEEKNDVRVVEVRATRGKAIRAEPLAGAYERGEVVHVGPAEQWAAYEQELLDFDPAATLVSPNRLDGACWGAYELAFARGRDGSISDGDPTVPIPRRRVPGAVDPEELGGYTEPVGGASGWTDSSSSTHRWL